MLSCHFGDLGLKQNCKQKNCIKRGKNKNTLLILWTELDHFSIISLSLSLNTKNGWGGAEG